MTSRTVGCAPRFVLALGILWAGSGHLCASEPPLLVLHGAAVFDSVAGRFVADRTIVIEGDRIRSVSSAVAAPPSGARLLDCRGKFVLPGLIDAHVHLVHLANRSHVTGDQFLPLFLANGVTSVRDAGVACVPRRMRDYWHSYRQESALAAETRDVRRGEFRKYQELTGLLHRAGVPLLVGTDTPEPFVPPGSSLHGELELLVASGLSPADVLSAATWQNARAMNQQDRLGTVEPGKLADLVILNADPTSDIRNTRQIFAVVRGGLVCDLAAARRAVPVE